MKSKKLIALLLTGLITISSLATPTLAISRGERSSGTTLTQEGTSFSVTVPTALPITVDENNNVTVATDIVITNNSNGPVKITKISKTEKNGWSLVRKPSTKTGAKDIEFDISVSDIVITSNSSTKVTYDAKVSPQKASIENETALDVIFTVDWDKENVSDIVSSKEKLIIEEEINLSIPKAEGQTVTWKNSNTSVAQMIIPTRARSTVFSEVVAGSEIQIKALNLGTTVITAVDNHGNTFFKNIAVVENSLKSIYIDKQPTKTTYRAGEIFDPAGMVVKAIYLNGDEYELPLYSYSKTPLVEGQQTIEISYEEKGISRTTNVSISVNKTQYNIIIENTIGGTITSNKDEAIENEEIILTINATAGYFLKEININGTLLTGNSFKMPNRDVTISAIFEKIPTLAVGTKFADDTYEYSYKQFWSGTVSVWHTSADQVGWGVRLKNKNISGKIPPPLTEIQGRPVTNYEFLFVDTKGLTLDLSLFDTSNVTSVYAMFYRAAATTINLSSFDTSKVTNMGFMFYGCPVSTLNLSSFDTSNVTNMNGMFQYTAIKTLDLSNFNTPNLDSITYMFAYARLSVIDLSTFDTSKVTANVETFHSCVATTGYARTEADAAKLNSPSGTKDSITFVVKPLAIGTKHEDATYEYSFGQRSDGTTWTTVSSLQGWGVRLKDKSLSGTIPAPLRAIRGYPVNYYYCLFNGSTASVLDVSKFNSSGVINMEGMFADSKATILDLRNLDTSSVISFGAMFRNAAATTINTSKFNTANATEMGEMFLNTVADPLMLSSFNTSKVNSIISMFQGSTAAIIDLSSFDTSAITNTSWAFANAKAKVGYARTASDVQKLNSAFFKPNELIFVVK